MEMCHSVRKVIFFFEVSSEVPSRYFTHRRINQNEIKIKSSSPPHIWGMSGYVYGQEGKEEYLKIST